MLKQTSFAILTFALSCPTTYSLDQPKLQRRDKWSACITDNRGCCDIYELIQRCWDTGVPSGNLDPNDHDVSNNFRTCFCGDTKTNSEDSWSACGHCIMEQWQENGFVTAENANILNFCATPDPNLYLWLTGFLNFTLTANPDALTPNHSPAAVLSGPVTAVATLASRYVQDPSANLIPASIFSLTTETLSFDPSSAHTTTYTVSSASHFHHTMTNSTPQAAAALTKTTTTTTSSGVTTDTSEGQVNDAILTVLYYKDAHTSMFIVGPASEVGSMLTLTRTDTGMATAPTGDTGGGGVTTGMFVKGSRTVLIVGPVETGRAGGGGATGTGGAVTTGIATGTGGAVTTGIATGSGVASGSMGQSGGNGVVSGAGDGKGRRLVSGNLREVLHLVLCALVGFVVVGRRAW